MNLSAVLDTNILISGVFWKGMPKRALNFARDGDVVGITSRAILMELRDVLTREKGSFRLTSAEADKVINELILFLQSVEPNRSIKICRDEKDNHVLEVASAGKAQYIVSNDNDLLVVVEFEGIRIVDAATFVRIVEALQRETED